MKLNFKDIVSIFFKKKKIVDFTLCFVLFYNCNCFFSQNSFNDRNKVLTEELASITRFNDLEKGVETDLYYLIQLFNSIVDGYLQNKSGLDSREKRIQIINQYSNNGTLKNWENLKVSYWDEEIKLAKLRKDFLDEGFRQISTLSEYDFKVEKIIELVKEYENNNGYSLKEFWPIIDNLKKIDQTTQNYKLLIELAQYFRFFDAFENKENKVAFVYRQDRDGQIKTIVSEDYKQDYILPFPNVAETNLRNNIKSGSKLNPYIFTDLSLLIEQPSDIKYYDFSKIDKQLISDETFNYVSNLYFNPETKYKENILSCFLVSTLIGEVKKDKVSHYLENSEKSEIFINNKSALTDFYAKIGLLKNEASQSFLFTQSTNSNELSPICQNCISIGYLEIEQIELLKKMVKTDVFSNEFPRLIVEFSSIKNIDELKQSINEFDKNILYSFEVKEVYLRILNKIENLKKSGNSVNTTFVTSYFNVYIEQLIPDFIKLIKTKYINWNIEKEISDLKKLDKNIDQLLNTLQTGEKKHVKKLINKLTTLNYSLERFRAGAPYNSQFVASKQYRNAVFFEINTLLNQ
jgi:hypothetical protein